MTPSTDHPSAGRGARRHGRARDFDPTHAEYLRLRPARHDGYTRTSRYLVMRDGARIAVDVCLPRGLGAGQKVPTIVRQTRYFRRFDVSALRERVLGSRTIDPMNAPMRELFTSRGYAWVDVDVRGSGASFGERPCPWYLEGEVADGAEIVDFIVRQPWSNGRVGSTGVSYEGTTAEFLAITAHPAVHAVAPRFCLFDIYTDVAFPGGIHNAHFTEAWERANEALDRNAPGEMVATIMAMRVQGAADVRVARRLGPLVEQPRVQAALRLLMTRALGGVAPVDEDGARAVLEEALLSHAKNFNVHTAAVHMTFRDDSSPNAPLPGGTSEDFSPHTYADRLRGDLPVLSYGGWFDGAYANGATKRQRALARRGGELLIGPWVHGGALDMDPDAPDHHAAFDHAAELLRFFDRHLRPEAAPPVDSPRVRYYLMGAGRWCTSATWPPEGTRVLELHFGAQRTLAREPATDDGFDEHAADLSTGAGLRSRWRTLLCPFLHADGKGRSPRGYLVYESEPFERDVEVTGHPVVVLPLASSASDGAVFAYLEDVDRDGEARLFTEGLLRIIHGTRLVEEDGAPPTVEAGFTRAEARRLEPGQMATHAIELLPTAMLVRRGHRLRLTLGAADVDHFATPPASGRITWSIARKGARLILPVRP